ncbi:hypothetical protein NDU88_001357 [Pleurodeles waltl]|uniref:Uncharacterized protein n=1 Tax=Pleurodeles waltl TaxID=8319 RepID=A0AAV7WI69_PLEWA|nr:hypothetical protein NDU88_001357 [Pleurodeles waltl]
MEDELLRGSLHAKTVFKQELTRAWEAWLPTHSHVYQWGDKASKMLHWLFTHRTASTPVAYLESTEGAHITGSGDIVTAFVTFYSTLYGSKSTGLPEGLYQFVEDVLVPRLSTEDRESLEVKVTSKELRLAHGQLHVGKAPGRQRLSGRILVPAIAACRPLATKHLQQGTGAC